MWCWYRREKISWNDCVRNEEVLHRDREDRSIVHTIKRRQLTGLVISCVGTAFWNTLLKERIEVMGRRGRRVKQLLDDLKERRATGDERRSTRSHPLENWLWKWLWTCRKADCGMNDITKLSAYRLIKTNQCTTPAAHHLHSGLEVTIPLPYSSLSKSQTILTPTILKIIHS